MGAAALAILLALEQMAVILYLAPLLQMVAVQVCTTAPTILVVQLVALVVVLLRKGLVLLEMFLQQRQPKEAMEVMAAQAMVVVVVAGALVKAAQRGLLAHQETAAKVGMAPYLRFLEHLLLTLAVEVVELQAER